MDKVLAEIPSPRAEKPSRISVAAIGNFDGLHLGHRALFAELYAAKQRLGGLSAVVTFHPHPLSVIRGVAPLLLSGEKMKNDMLRDDFGVDQVVTLNFDLQLMNTSPEKFVQDIIIDQLQAKEIIVGYNFTYAARGRGTAQLLQQQCAAHGVKVTIIDEVCCDYGVVSSSNIRRALEQGQLDVVNTMLGYWFALEGEVIYGNQIGRSLGFPTANFLPQSEQALPPIGVYAARILHQGKLYGGVSNFGIKPTIGGEKKPLVEAHLFDVDLPLYGESIRVYFGQYLRPEQRFDNLEQLKEQISADSRAAREFLRQTPIKYTLPKRIR
jgi:riboflavin kinase/FMN adenylyltransferase